METKKFIIWSLGISIALAVIFQFIPIPRQSRVGGAYLELLPQFPLSDKREGLTPRQQFFIAELELSAESALVKDKNSNVVLFEKNSREKLPIASLTKLMTALVALRELKMDEVVTISPEDTRVSPYKANLAAGEKLLARDLLKAMLVLSANDAAWALARAAGGTVKDFVLKMNSEARSLGMLSTAFTNPVGFDDDGHYSTAADLAILVEEVLRHPELVEIASLKEATINSVDGRITHRLLTTNKLMLKYKEISGLKTGYTTEAKGNLIVLVQEGPALLYFIVLNSDDRETETERALTWVKQSFVWR
ncbi:MAG: serine hydrolase [bacterium]|nr:serine hydrolase [bacterium]